MRKINVIKNITTALIGQLFGILGGFIARAVFVRILGAEYLGVNGLFTNILSIIALAELGFGTAIVYSIYKPLAVNDEKKVMALMNYYASVYRIIGFCVLGIGILLLPFLDYFIKDKPDIPNLHVIYLLFLANSVVTYFFAHKRSLIIADQKNYIVTIYHYAFFVALNIVQIIILIITKNYFLFLCAQVVGGFLENLLISRKADRMYPYLKQSKGVKLDEETRKLISKNVKAMMCHRLGGTVVINTSNILIASFVGIVWVGIYSNYQLIISAVDSIIAQIFTSTTASIGNLNALESKEKSFRIFKSIFLINFWLSGFCAISLYILFNPFITLWLGQEYVLNEVLVFLIVLNYYVSGMRRTTLTFRDSLGLFWNDRYKPVFEATINLVVSTLLVRHFGLMGAFLGMFVSTMTTCFWVEPYILYKYGFNQNIKGYLVQYGIYSSVTATAGVLVWFICSVVSTGTWYDFLGRLLVCITVPNLLFLLCFRRTDEFKYLSEIASELIKKFYKVSPGLRFMKHGRP